MRHELKYFSIDGAYGGCQDWFPDRMMNLGGCAAATACDSCLYFELHGGFSGLYPFDKRNLSRADYVAFADIMKPYLHPRWTGIDRLDIYIDGMGKFLADRGQSRLALSPWEGSATIDATKTIVKKQLASGLPIPFLLLRHKNEAFAEYVWHWFLLNGYDETADGRFLVKAVTYGEAEWLDLALMWDTGYDKKGGLIIYRLAA